jgi:hypothetical protein
MGPEQTQTDERNYTRRRFITASASPVALAEELVVVPGEPNGLTVALKSPQRDRFSRPSHDRYRPGLLDGPRPR